MGKRKYPVLPYDLRLEIWDLIDKGDSTEQIIAKTYDHVPPGVSKGQFEYCIRGIRGRHTLGQRPSQRENLN